MIDPRELLCDAKYVFFDFDGPICRLFSGHPASVIAERMRRAMAAHGIPLDPVADPHAVLRVAAELADRTVVAELEQMLTEEEVRAAATARPTASADPLIRALHGTGRRLAVTTNNSAAAAASYLASRGLAGCFGGQVYGRSGDPARLKPDPDCVIRALEGTGAHASDALLLGDSRSDWLAARAAGVAFLGYARNERKWEELRPATVVVRSLEQVLDAVLRTHGD
ncbi:HAD family hydrolase [Streptomyces sp. NPDC048696]|uniref:HAD family hydrolase n=1 Tax=Streptomyces sp. NPDC048696 TaxID=3365585 RepID=UPI00371CAD0D